MGIGIRFFKWFFGSCCCFWDFDKEEERFIFFGRYYFLFVWYVVGDGDVLSCLMDFMGLMVLLNFGYV